MPTRYPAKIDMSDAKLDHLERAVASVLSIVVLLLGLVNCIAGEGIWRDEASTVALAKMPLSELWSLLPFESFPPLFHFVLKSLFWLGIPQSPLSLRIIGFCIGLMTLALLWWRLRKQGGSPLASLVLFASVPAMIRYGQSIRAYGLATIFGIALISFTWEYVQKPSWKNVLPAALFGLLGVHCLYQSSFLLACVCLGAAAAICIRRSWKQLAGVVAMVLPAAMTVPIYFHTVSKGAVGFAVFADTAIGPNDLLRGLITAVSPYGQVPAFWWLGLLAIFFMIAVPLLRQHAEAGVTDSAATIYPSRELAVFCVVTGVSFTGATVLVLWLAGTVIRPWHLFLWMGVIAALADNVLAAGKTSLSARTRLVIVSMVIVAVAGNVRIGWSMLDRNYTSIGAIAKALEAQASSRDLILIYPYWYGVSFNYYYHGITPWVTIPPLTDVRIHRSDLIMAAIQQSVVMEPIEQQVRQTLVNGGSVWLAGAFEDSGDIVPIAPTGWYQGPWLRYWSARVTAVLKDAGATRCVVPLKLDRAIHVFENPPLTVARKSPSITQRCPIR